MSCNASTKSSSAQTSSTYEESDQGSLRKEYGQARQSSLSSAFDKTKSALSNMLPQTGGKLTESEKLERLEARQVEKQQRKEEYERLGLREQTIFGMPGGRGTIG